jgi:integrase
MEYNAWKRHSEYVGLHIIPGIGGIRLRALAPQHAQVLYSERLGSGLSTSTVHHLHATLHNALKDAERLRRVARNVTKLVNVPRMAESEIHPLNRDEARILLDVASGERLHALYALVLATEMRQSELLGPQWPELDLARGLARVRWQLKRADGVWAWKQPKTRRSRRQIALSPSTVVTVRAHRAAQEVERAHVGMKWEDYELVFCTRLGRPLSARHVFRSFQLLFTKGALPRIRFHDLRLTGATLLRGGRVNPKVVSETLGRSTVAITLDIYRHVLRDMQQDAAATLERALYQ